LRFRRSEFGRRVMRLVRRVVELGIRIFSIVMKVVGPFFALIALGLISFCTYTYFLFVLPLLGDGDALGMLRQVVMTSVGVFLLSSTLYNYGKSMFMDAGTPPLFDDAKLSNIVDAGEELGEPSPPKSCRKCGRWKPPRAHHCSVCNRCVLKMDHHCPWINNCVGWRNYRHFCLFMLYLASTCVYAVIVFIGALVLHSEKRPASDRWSSLFFATANEIMEQLMTDSDDSGHQCIMMSVMLAAVIFFALCCLGGMHVFLLLTNQTTIEFQMNMITRQEARSRGVYWRNPYDLGRRRNFEQVFGPNPFCRFRWLLPYIAKPPEGDGTVFPSLWRLKA